MRLDKFLKVSRIIKRRTVASDAAKGNRILVNGKPAKPSKDVKAGDVITISFGNSEFKAKILSTPEFVKAEDSKDIYEVI